jgi:soluble lytic murein transglycosylase
VSDSRPEFAWRWLGGLAARGPRLFALAYALALVGRIAAPTPIAARAASVDAAPAEAGLTGDAAQIDEILAQKAPNLGLELRQELASAMVEEAKNAKLDPYLVLAVMRVESEFDEDALSNRGARGLMQLRPSTLAFLARREGIRLPIEDIEQDPVLSTRLAVRYLGRLQASFHGDIDRALMAYNTGPHRLHVAVKARDSERLDRLSAYPRAVRRAYRRFRALPPSDDTAIAERSDAPSLGDLAGAE